MTALVFGATGLTGRHTVEVLRARGERTIAHVRPDSGRLEHFRELFGKRGAELDTTPWLDAEIRAAFVRHAPTRVFGLLGTTQSRAKKEGIGGGSAAYDAVDIRLTEMLVGAAAALPNKPRFVYLSSAGAGGGGGAYLLARKRVEETLIASGVPYTIARPSFIVGDRDEPRLAEKLGAPIADGALGLLGFFGGKKTAARYRSITGEELAQALVRLSFDPRWANRIAEREDL